MKFVQRRGCLALAAAVGLLASPLSGRAQTLTERSPFMPEGGPAAVAPTENAPLELRGIVTTKSGTLFGIYDPTKRQSSWVRMNESGADFTVQAHDAENDTVTVEYQGQSLTLALKAAKVESMGSVPNPAQVNMPRPINQPPVALNPTPADEARRLEGVAAEVRRRRMLRQQAAQQQNQSMPQPRPGGPAPVPRPQ